MKDLSSPSFSQCAFVCGMDLQIYRVASNFGRSNHFSFRDFHKLRLPSSH